MVTVYGKLMCPSCTKAKEYLTKHGVPFEYKELNKDYSITDFYDVAPKSHRTFPMVAVNGLYVGSFDDYLKLNAVKLS